MTYELKEDYQEGTILSADYERDFEGTLQVRLVLKIYNTFGVANMFFIGDKKINELLDNFCCIRRDKITCSLQDMVNKEVFMPKACFNCIPEGISFCSPLVSDYFEGFVKNCNNRRDEIEE